MHITGAQTAHSLSLCMCVCVCMKQYTRKCLWGGGIREAFNTESYFYRLLEWLNENHIMVLF